MGEPFVLRVGHRPFRADLTAVGLGILFLLLSAAGCSGRAGSGSKAQRPELAGQQMEPASAPKVGALCCFDSLRVESLDAQTADGCLRWVMALKNVSKQPVKANLRPRYFADDGRELVKGPLYSLALDLAPGESVVLTDTAPTAGATTYACEFVAE